MDNLEAYIKLDNDIKHRPATFQGTTAEWEALSAAEKAYYIDGIVNLSDDSLDPEVVDSVPTQNSTHLVQSGGVWSGLNTVNSNFGTVELSSTAAYAHAVGETFINAAGQMVKCTAAIAVGDTIATGTNVASTSVSAVLSELNSNIKHTSRLAYTANEHVISYSFYTLIYKTCNLIIVYLNFKLDQDMEAWNEALFTIPNESLDIQTGSLNILLTAYDKSGGGVPLSTAIYNDSENILISNADRASSEVRYTGLFVAPIRPK